jgi:para-nitrobenzyl esterase
MKKLIQLIIAAALITCLVSCGGGNTDSASPPTAQTDTGKVQGAVRNGVIEYRGIPYAEAPVGHLRWALPVSKAAWSGTLDATNFGSACPQQSRYSGLTDSSTTEDCLSINVTVPADIKPGERLPVIFWIHGGAYVGGSSNLYRLDKLANQGRVIVVSPNYRIGILGFMPLTPLKGQLVNGNFGLEDQRLAMRWVQRNIAAFGGDASNVTLAGESAGAASICAHLTAPEATDALFHKAIVMSFGCLAPMKSMDDIFTEVSGPVESDSKYLNCSGSGEALLQCLRNKSVEEILQTQGKFTADNATNPRLANPFFTVYGTKSVPNVTMPRSFKEALDTQHLRNVPLLIGGAKNELGLYVGYFWQANQANPNAPPINASSVERFWLPFFYGNNSTVVSGQYEPTVGWSKATDNQSAEILSQALSDHNPLIGFSGCLYLHTYNSIRQYPGASPLYVYEFADPDALVNGVGITEPYPPFPLGPVHSSILNYVFPNYSNNSKMNAQSLPDASEALSLKIVDAWTRFATTGKPSMTGVTNWPTYSGGSSVMKLIPNQVGLFNADEAHRCSSFWKGLYPGSL